MSGDSEDLSRGGGGGEGKKREGKERKINTRVLPVIFLFGDRINILLG